MAQSQYKIIKEIHRFETPDNTDYHKELNLISWFGKEPKYDIRGWTEDRSKMSKGISLAEAEFKELIKIGGIENENNSGV